MFEAKRLHCEKPGDKDKNIREVNLITARSDRQLLQGNGNPVVKSLMFGYHHFAMRLGARVARFARTRVIVEQHGVLGTEVRVVTGGRSQEIVDLGLCLSALLGVNPGIPVFEGVPGADDEETGGIIQRMQGLARDVAFRAEESGAIFHEKFIEQ